MLMRRLLLSAFAASAATVAVAHHGIVWTVDEQVNLTGIVVAELTGNPHYEIKIQVGDTRWAVDLGDSYRLNRAELGPRDFPHGREITVRGFAASDPGYKLIKARTIFIDGKPHVLYEEGEAKE